MCKPTGKRAWKDSTGSVDTATPSETGGSRRNISNTLFRGHQLSELTSEARFLVQSPAATRNRTDSLVRLLLTRLLYFGEDNNKGTPKQFKTIHMNTLWQSFGLKTILEQELVEKKKEKEKDNRKKDKDDSAKDSKTMLLKRLKGKPLLAKADRQAILQSVGLRDLQIFGGNGVVNFLRFFETGVSWNQEEKDKQEVSTTNKEKNKKKLPEKANTEQGGNKNEKARKQQIKTPIDVELGAGLGDWIVQQALANPNRHYVPVEIRADRVARTFAKMALSSVAESEPRPISNLCCVRAESELFLNNRVRPKSVSRIFVNHPEPPTQTFGTDDERLHKIANDVKDETEPRHMLQSSVLEAAFKCLQDDGKLIVVTDNQWYGRLIAATIVRTQKRLEGSVSIRDGRLKGMEVVELFGVDGDGNSTSSKGTVIRLCQGQPDERIHHTASSSSYFDRLWKIGAGNHACCTESMHRCDSPRDDGSDPF